MFKAEYKKAKVKIIALIIIDILIAIIMLKDVFNREFTEGWIEAEQACREELNVSIFKGLAWNYYWLDCNAAQDYMKETWESDYNRKRFNGC